jgi:DNA processing protein
MFQALSPNTQAILLLTAPLIARAGTSSPDLLSPGEYKRLTRFLREVRREPADLLSTDAAALLRACQPIVDESRLQRLLGRGFQLGSIVERWQARSIWVVSRADSHYPGRLKGRLREEAPAVLYGCGDIGLVEAGGLAVVGSRHAGDVLIDYAMNVGRLAARSGRAVVSGGARGIDQAAMSGALDGGGKAVGILADSLEKTSLNRDHRNLLLDGRMVLVSPYDPAAGFNVGNAMRRNKVIYALADASLVVSADLEKGGTWAGAIEQIDKLRFVRVYVRSTGTQSAGINALRGRGALPWPEPVDEAGFDAVFEPPGAMLAEPSQPGLDLVSSSSGDEWTTKVEAFCRSQPGAAEERAVVSDQDADAAGIDHRNEASTPRPATTANDMPPDRSLFAAAREAVLRVLDTPKKEREIAAALDISNAQAKIWLGRLIEDGSIQKHKRPAVYRAEIAAPLPTAQPTELPLDKSLFAAVREAVLQIVDTPRKDTEIAAALNVSYGQARAWLGRMVDDGSIQKQRRSAVYSAKRKSLFE